MLFKKNNNSNFVKVDLIKATMFAILISFDLTIPIQQSAEVFLHLSIISSGCFCNIQPSMSAYGF